MTPIKFVLSLVISAMLPSFASAVGGFVGVGNGTDDPSRSRSLKQQENAARPAINPTAEYARERNEKVTAIIEELSDITNEEVAELLEENYGLNIFEITSCKDESKYIWWRETYKEDGYKQFIVNQKNHMNAAALYFLDLRVGWLSKVDILNQMGTVKWFKYYGGSFDWHSDVIPFFLFKRGGLCSVKKVDGQYDVVGVKSPTRSKSYLRESTIVYRFKEALDRSRLNSLNATVVFGKVQKKNIKEDRSVTVVYPEFNAFAPIPQPIVYILDDVSDKALDIFLMNHGAKIAAFNQLFDLEGIPQVQEIIAAVRGNGSGGSRRTLSNSQVEALDNFAKDYKLNEDQQNQAVIRALADMHAKDNSVVSLSTAVDQDSERLVLWVMANMSQISHESQ